MAQGEGKMKVYKVYATSSSPWLKDQPGVLAQWSTSGGHHWAAVVVVPPFPLEKWERGMKKIDELTSREVLPAMQKLVDFVYRELDSRIELAVPPSRVGWWIGKNGWRVKALHAACQKKVKILPAVLVVARVVVPPAGDTEMKALRKTLECYPHLLLYPHRISICDSADCWVAPWGVEELILGINHLGSWKAQVE